MEISVSNNQYVLIVDKEIYSSDVLHQCFYWYTGDFEVEISVHDQQHYRVILNSINDDPDLETLIRKIKRDLVDFKLRQIVTRDTQNIRDLIVAKAFANYETEEEEPAGEISDPVGFDPSVIQ